MDTFKEIWYAFMWSRNATIESSRPNSLMKSWHLCVERDFVSPSARITVLGTHVIESFPLETSWRSLCLWMSTCLIFVTSRLVVRAWIVCKLSHYIESLKCNMRLISSKGRQPQIYWLVVVDRASRSASVKPEVTVRCLEAFQSIKPLNNLNAYEKVRGL